MKKIKKMLSEFQISKIDFDQLSQLKGGLGGHDLFSSTRIFNVYEEDDPELEAV